MQPFKDYERRSCPNGKGAVVYLPETANPYTFTIPGNAQISTATYNEGAQWANSHGCDFEVQTDA